MTSYDFRDQTETDLTIKNTDTNNFIQPNAFGNKKLKLDEFYSPIRYYESDLSPLFRTRDLVGDISNYPISSVVKLIKIVDEKEVGTCTGTLVSNDFLITASHCIKTEKNVYPDKILVLPLYDNGAVGYEGDSIFVEKVFYKKGYDKYNVAENYDDMGLYKISKEIGKELGHIGLKSISDDVSALPIYSFSYPNENFVKYLKDLRKTQTDSAVIKEIDKVIRLQETHTPDFNKKNQYFKYGKIRNVEKGKSFEMKTPYAIPGESGASWISNDYYFLGVNSSQANGLATYCNNNEILSAFLSIINEDNARKN